MELGLVTVPFVVGAMLDGTLERISISFDEKIEDSLEGKDRTVASCCG